MFPASVSISVFVTPCAMPGLAAVDVGSLAGGTVSVFPVSAQSAMRPRAWVSVMPAPAIPSWSVYRSIHVPPTFCQNWPFVVWMYQSPSAPMASSGWVGPECSVKPPPVVAGSLLAGIRSVLPVCAHDGIIA